VRLDVEVQWGEQPDGLELCINSRREALAGTGLVPVGYSCQVAGWNGLIDFISRNEATEGRHTAGARHALTEGGTISRVGFYREDDQFVLEVAGREPIRQIYPLPITGEQLGGVGLRTFANGAVLRRLRVSRHVSGSIGSPLARGDALAMTGAYEVAAQEYQAIAAVHTERSIGAPALARAYLAYHQLGDRPLELAALRRRLAERYPESDYYRLVLEAEVLELWRQGQEATALAHFDRISQRFGTSEVLLRCLDLRRSSLAPDLAQGFLERIARNRQLSVLDLHGLGLVDCSPIQDLPLVWLDLGANPIADISTLRGMPLRRLSLAHTRVSDLRPLAGKPLMLHLSGCPVTTLRGLEGTPLIELWADESGLDDLSVLAGNDTLQKLNLSATGVQDLSPLRAAPLSEFYASGSQVVDLGPLSGKPLKEVYLDGTGVSDISPIANPELRILSMRELGIASIEPLRQVPRLRQLDVTGNRLTDLEVLQGKPLEFLSCRDNRIADMAVLAAFDRLQLICHQNPITSLGWMLDAPPEGMRVPPLEALPEAELERGLAAWGIRRPELAMYCATRLAWLRDDPALAFAHALPREGQRIAILAEPMPLDAAQALATAWGGELIVPDGAQAISSLRRLASGSDRLWTGLVKLEGGALAAANGRPVSLTGSSVHGAAGPVLLWEWDALHVVEPAYRAWPVIVWSR